MTKIEFEPSCHFKTHMAKIFTTLCLANLSTTCHLEVQKLSDGSTGEVQKIPSGYVACQFYAIMKQKCVRLMSERPISFCRPFDVMFGQAVFPNLTYFGRISVSSRT